MHSFELKLFRRTSYYNKETVITKKLNNLKVSDDSKDIFTGRITIYAHNRQNRAI
jgi:hypothetical protein